MAYGKDRMSFPAEGIWLVHKKGDHKTCIMSMNDLKAIHLPTYASLMLKYEEKSSEMVKNLEALGPHSINDLVKCVLQTISEGNESIEDWSLNRLEENL